MTSTKPDRFAIRCDASLDIGSGHVMRCLNIARGLRQHGAASHFICRDLPGNLMAHIHDNGFRVSAIDPHNDDAGSTLDLLPVSHTVIVDHYGLNDDWHHRLKNDGHRLVAIDDLADRPFECDMLVNPNIYPTGAAPYAGLVAAGTVLLVGPDYALIDPAAIRHRPARPRLPGGIARAVLFFGGSDLVNMTEKALRAALAVTPAITAIDVVLGKNYTFTDSLLSYRDAASVTIHSYIADFPGFLAGADLFVGAGGSTQLERCCLGIPALVTAIADNQVVPAQNMAAMGASHYVGWHEDVTPQTLATILQSLADDPCRLRAMAESSFALVDGRGIERLCGFLAGRA